MTTAQLPANGASNSPAVQIRLLGGVAAATGDGTPVDIGPAKCQAVLAALAMSAGSAVPVSRLVELVWGEEPPRTAEKTLQSYMTRLRKSLGQEAIVRNGTAYRLAVDASAVDVLRFQRLLEAGQIDAALAEWTGAPLAGLDAGGLTPAVDGLIEQWLGAVETDLLRGIEREPAAAISSLTELTATYPFREGLWALLMTALYRVGRQAEALAAFRRARQQLIEHLGVEPGPRLRELEALILRQDEQLSVGTAPEVTRSDLPTGTVTFGFCSLDAPPRLWSTHRREMAATTATVDEIVRTTVTGYGGHLFTAAGDSFGAAFHRASDALSWAADVVSAVSATSTVSAGSPGGTGELGASLLIGLHTGEAEERSGDYFGPAVNVAERIATAGHGGQILVSGTTAALLDRVDLTDLGRYATDGAGTEQHVLQVGDRSHPPLRIEGGGRGNLPRRLGRLIGRYEALQVVDGALAASPVVTLVGPGGIGKTRLALAAAHLAAPELVSGAWLIELAGISSSSEVPRVVATTLQVPETPRRTLTQSIVEALRSADALLVLDNCEHVVDGAAELAQAIADGCPDVRLLATSREGLGLDGEQLIAVAPLEPAGPGVELFNERASAADQTFDAAASRRNVEEICRRLDGVPLAIELAAARIRSLSPADLVERLDDRLRLLTGGRRTSVERHRTLRATIQWSYDLLSPVEQVVFGRLSVFAGPFDLTAAETVAAGAGVDAGADDLIGGLVERSMVAVESGPYGRRFRLLETMRQFGAQHLAEAGDTDLIAGRHAQWCLAQVASIRRLLAGPAEVEGVTQLDELWPNLRAAVDWACATGDASLANDLVLPISAEVYLRNRSEIGDWAERILAIAEPDDGELVTTWITWAARRYMRHMDRRGYERLVARYGEPDHPLVRYARAFLRLDHRELAEAASLAIADLREQGDDYATTLFELAGLGLTLTLTGRLEEHHDLMTDLVARCRAAGPPTGLRWSLDQLAYAASIRGDYAQAWRYFEEAARVEVPNRTNTMKNPLDAQGAFRQGRHAEAFRSLALHLDELLANDNMYLVAMAATQFLTMTASIGRLREAAPVLAYLERSGLVDVPRLRATVDAAAGRITAAAEPDWYAPLAGGDDRQALVYMGEVIERLLDELPSG